MYVCEWIILMNINRSIYERSMHEKKKTTKRLYYRYKLKKSPHKLQKIKLTQPTTAFEVWREEKLI